MLFGLKSDGIRYTIAATRTTASRGVPTRIRVGVELRNSGLRLSRRRQRTSDQPTTSIKYQRDTPAPRQRIYTIRESRVAASRRPQRLDTPGSDRRHRNQCPCVCCSCTNAIRVYVPSRSKIEDRTFLVPRFFQNFEIHLSFEASFSSNLDHFGRFKLFFSVILYDFFTIPKRFQIISGVNSSTRRVEDCQLFRILSLKLIQISFFFFFFLFYNLLNQILVFRNLFTVKNIRSTIPSVNCNYCIVDNNCLRTLVKLSNRSKPQAAYETNDNFFHPRRNLGYFLFSQKAILQYVATRGEKDRGTRTRVCGTYFYFG